MKSKGRLGFENKIVINCSMLQRGLENEDREVAIGSNKMKVVDFEKGRFSWSIGKISMEVGQ